MTKPNGHAAEVQFFSQAAQKAVLGSFMCLNPLIDEVPLSVADLVGSSDKAIYSCMLEQWGERQPFDAVTLAQRLEERGQLESAGGAAYIGELIDGAVPNAGIVRAHVATIQRFAKLRRLKAFGETIISGASDLRADPDLLTAEVERRLQSLSAGDSPNGPRDLSRHAEILTLSNVQSKEVDWLWRPYLANGMLAMLSGDPGAGKTYIALAIAAALTVGRTPSSRAHAVPG